MSDRPMAAPGLVSYRYRGPYGWIMIGAVDDSDAMRETARSLTGAPDIASLEIWVVDRYVPILEAAMTIAPVPFTVTDEYPFDPQRYRKD